MVGVESWVTGGSEQVGAWVATDGVVNAAVGTNLDCVRDALGEQAVLRNVRFA